MKKSILAILFLVAALPAFSQQSFSLKEAKEYGKQNSYVLKNSRSDLEKSEKKVKEVLAIGLPQVNIEGTFQHFLNLPTTVIPANAFNPMAPADELIGVQFGTDFNVTGALKASQLLFDGSYLVGLQATRSIAQLSMLSVSKSVIEVENEITKAYNNVLVAQESVKTLKMIVENTEKLFKETKAIYETGLSEEQDVDQLDLTLTNLKNNLKRAEMMEEAAVLTLKLHMGMDLETPITLSDSMETLTGDVNAEQLSGESFSLDNNVDHQMMETQVRLSELNMKNEKMKYYPTFAAFFSQQYQAFRNDFDFFEDKPWYPGTIWGLSLNVPVFSSGMRYQKVAQNRIEMEKAQVQLKQLDESLKLQVKVARIEFINAYDTWQEQKRSLELAESIQSKTLVKYKEGVASSMELTIAQNQYLNAQTQYVSATATLLQAKAALDKLFAGNTKN